MPDFEAGAILLINKPLRWTSFDVVNKVRNTLKKTYPKLKVGHAGTLDPLADGLLIVCTGKMTKIIDTLQASDKTYTGIFHLGATTPSYDLETEIDKRYDIAHIKKEDLDCAASSFIGNLEQLPPIYSAIKKEGKALYLSARKGKEVELSPRSIYIKQFKITSHVLPEIHFDVTCSKGTYIRSLAYDFGKAMNSGAYLAQLTRTRSGDFDLNDAWNLEQLIEYLQGIQS